MAAPGVGPSKRQFVRMDPEDLYALIEMSVTSQAISLAPMAFSKEDVLDHVRANLELGRVFDEKYAGCVRGERRRFHCKPDPVTGLIELVEAN